MRPAEIELIEILHKITEQKPASKNNRDLFVQYLDELISHLNEFDKANPGLRTRTFPLVLFKMKLSSSKKYTDIRGFQSVIDEVFEEWFRIISQKPIQAKTADKIDAFFTILNRLPWLNNSVLSESYKDRFLEWYDAAILDLLSSGSNKTLKSFMSSLSKLPPDLRASLDDQNITVSDEVPKEISLQFDAAVLDLMSSGSDKKLKSFMTCLSKLPPSLRVELDEDSIEISDGVAKEICLQFNAVVLDVMSSGSNKKLKSFIKSLSKLPPTLSASLDEKMIEGSSEVSKEISLKFDAAVLNLETSDSDETLKLFMSSIAKLPPTLAAKLDDKIIEGFDKISSKVSQQNDLDIYHQELSFLKKVFLGQSEDMQENLTDNFLKSYSSWIDNLFEQYDSEKLSKQLKRLTAFKSDLPQAIRVKINAVNLQKIPALSKRQSTVLDSFEDSSAQTLMLKMATPESNADQLSTTDPLMLTKHFDMIVKHIKSHSESLEDPETGEPLESFDAASNDILLNLKTRRLAQNLLRENNVKAFQTFLKSDNCRDSKGRCEALSVANAYVEMGLDRLSKGQRDSMKDEILSELEGYKSTFESGLRKITVEEYAKNIPTLFKTMRECIYNKEDVNDEDPELRLFCTQKIEHAIVKRRFSFKARPKHFNYIDAAQSMRDLRQTFDAAGIDFFLMSGTLLGAVREKGFIASDYDIDLGIFDSQADIPLLHKICANSSLFSIDEVVENSIVKVKHISGIVIDLFIYFEVDGLQCHRGGIHEWYNSDFGLTEIDFLGGKYYIPDNHEEWLTENYGNWKKPVLFYDMSYDTPNRDYISTSTKGIYYLQDRITNALRNGWNNYIRMGFNALSREFQLDFTKHLLPALSRENKTERAETKFSPDDIKTIIVDYYDSLTAESVQVLQSTDLATGPCLAGVLGDNYVASQNKGSRKKSSTNVTSSHSFVDRCKSARVLNGVDGVISFENSEELRKAASLYKNAEFIYMNSAVKKLCTSGSRGRK